jgi:hypothetical protein
MAQIIQREWKSGGPTGRRVRQVAFGYTLTVNGKRERKFSSDWLCEADALKTLTERQEEIRACRTDRRQDVRFGQVTDRYLQFHALVHGRRMLVWTDAAYSFS